MKFVVWKTWRKKWAQLSSSSWFAFFVKCIFVVAEKLFRKFKYAMCECMLVLETGKKLFPLYIYRTLHGTSSTAQHHYMQSSRAQWRGFENGSNSRKKNIVSNVSQVFGVCISNHKMHLNKQQQKKNGSFTRWTSKLFSSSLFRMCLFHNFQLSFSLVFPPINLFFIWSLGFQAFLSYSTWHIFSRSDLSFALRFFDGFAEYVHLHTHTHWLHIAQQTHTML